MVVKPPASLQTEAPKGAAVGLARWEKQTAHSRSQLQTAEPDTNCNLKNSTSIIHYICFLLLYRDEQHLILKTCVLDENKFALLNFIIN